ncbi:MAG: hypothetical protein GTN62_14160 [Gemmatimonadales bacterium]|nr:hypothetical protein [Gemmatimonadales bacterium]NIN13215.1 hypothetical protein [Gemmatimonadales bacterium]NIN51232.1 hypothetical protein [Gemmatimonadales bacterium]NIP08696.1 hypothetical protein [Gemmatimonadales bacterium]NIR00949.1 hypothetical protein [Gemmatimonadales bacterium]
MRSFKLLSSTVLLAGCAAAGAGPTFEFGPTDVPLRYGIESAGNIVLEIPGGPTQTSEDKLSATVMMEIGQPGPEGRPVSAVFDALEASSSGDMGSTRQEGGSLIGMRYAGTLTEGGTINFSDPPETPSHLKDVVDPVALLVNLLVPLPPGAEAAGTSWPVNTTVTSRTALTMTAIYAGTARVAGDTTWNGQVAKVIVSEGTLELHGTGTPPGSPAEIDMVMTGPSTRLYIWDPQRGVMLASSTSGEYSGDIEVIGMGMTIPVSYKETMEVVLRNR